MRKCPACGQKSPTEPYDNYCTSCGEKMVEAPAELRLCSNLECRRHIEREHAWAIMQFCGECGSLIVRYEVADDGTLMRR